MEQGCESQGLCRRNISILGFPRGSDGEESACNAGDLGFIPGSGRSPGEGDDNPLQYSCLENSMDRGAWQSAVHGVAKSQTWLSNNTHPEYIFPCYFLPLSYPLLPPCCVHKSVLGVWIFRLSPKLSGWSQFCSSVQECALLLSPYPIC